MKYRMFYGNFEAVVESYEEAEQILAETFGYYDHDEVFLEEEEEI